MCNTTKAYYIEFNEIYIKIEEFSSFMKKNGKIQDGG
jgi:hypothetical protein